MYDISNFNDLTYNISNSNISNHWYDTYKFLLICCELLFIGMVYAGNKNFEKILELLMIDIDNDDKDCIIQAYKQRQQQRKQTQCFSSSSKWLSLFQFSRLLLNSIANQQRQGNTMTNTLITLAMLSAIVVPMIIIGISDAKRYPWGK